MGTNDLSKTVDEACNAMEAAARTVTALRRALLPFVEAFCRQTNPGESDLDDEQPYNLRVTLGDLRRARNQF